MRVCLRLVLFCVVLVCVLWLLIGLVFACCDVWLVVIVGCLLRFGLFGLFVGLFCYCSLFACGFGFRVCCLVLWFDVVWVICLSCLFVIDCFVDVLMDMITVLLLVCYRFVGGLWGLGCVVFLLFICLLVCGRLIVPCVILIVLDVFVCYVLLT